MKKFLLITLSAVLLSVSSSVSVWAQVGGRIFGVLKDQSGAVVPGAAMVLRNTSTGVEQATATDQGGAYAFPNLLVGKYELAVTVQGFKPYKRSGLTVDVGSALQADIGLEVAEENEVVTVEASTVQVNTSDTQIGETISEKQVVAVPLNGRSYTDLLAVQSGVIPASTNANVNASSGGAFGTIAPSGDLNAGQFSINGQRETFNGFTVNGANVVEGISQAAAIVPNLDSIAEFRILATNVDAEFGKYSGGIVSVVTKSGGDHFHGSAFEFLRNTALDARGFFDPTVPEFKQNQFGGTFGGPINKKNTFFFLDYQGARTTQGLSTGAIPVPSLANRAGNFSDLCTPPTNPACPFNSGITQVSFADQLSQKLGTTITPGQTKWSDIFPGNIIPQSAFSPAAVRLLQFIPTPNVGATTFSTAALALTNLDNKGSARVDANTKYGQLSAYYAIDIYHLNNPYPTAQAGANVPFVSNGQLKPFNALSDGKAQLISLTDTKSFGTTMVNEARISYMRNTNNLGQAQGGVGVSLADQGIQGINPGFPKYQGVENLVFNNFSVGATPFALLQVNQLYQGQDNFTKVLGPHAIKFGGEAHVEHVKQDVNLLANGQFLFNGSSTGSDFADFLLGLPSLYSQQSTPQFTEKTEYAGIFAQDSWRLRPNLTLNYGVRWEYIQPWSEEHNQISTLILGEQSQKFPGAPQGYVFPGDRGIPSTIAHTPWNDFSPRLGLAYSPNFSNGLLGKITGGPGKTSIRLGFGRFFTTIEGLTAAYPTGNPPDGLTYTSPEAPFLTNPFVGATTGAQYVQPFPVKVPPFNVSPRNPNNFDFGLDLPIGGAVSFFHGNPTPYSENYTLSVERELAKNTVLTTSYIGSQGHHLLTLLPANPGNPGLCLGLSQSNQVAVGSPTCGPLAENLVFTRPDGTVVNGTRGPFGNNFASDAYFYNFANSSYHALEVTIKHQSKGLYVLGSYTYGKSIDMASSIQEGLNPSNFKLERGISAFDIRHNFVVSYRYDLPFDHLLHKANRLTQGWSLSGITRVSTGLPVTFFSFTDNSLIGSQQQGVNAIGSDTPDITGQPLNLNHNPRNGQPYFNPLAFQSNALGTPGNAKRRFFYGPGQQNWDMALLKTTRLTESKTLELRFEAFNVFNHAQFFGPNTIGSNIANPASFGRVLSADPGRVCQAAAKFTF